MHIRLKYLVSLLGLQFVAFGAFGQDVADLAETLRIAPGNVIMPSSSGGIVAPLSDTFGMPGSSILDISSIPVSDLPGLGAAQGGLLAGSASGGGAGLVRENVDNGQKKVNTFDGVQFCDDDDSDGVCNQEDYCANTPPLSIVMPSGCHLSRDAPLELVGVFFDFNGSTLRPESYEILDRVVALLVQQDTVVVEIGGHTDSRGDLDTNVRLSRERAKAVYEYLIKRGIAAYRLTYKGYGSSQPVAPNQLVGGTDNADGRARNRRVDMRVVNDLATLQKSHARN